MAATGGGSAGGSTVGASLGTADVDGAFVVIVKRNGGLSSPSWDEWSMEMVPPLETVTLGEVVDGRERRAEGTCMD